MRVIYANAVFANLVLLVLVGCSSGGGDDSPTPPPNNVAVPDVVGQMQAAAESAITSAGLTVGTVTNQSSGTVPTGNVINQNPGASTMVAANSSVDITVSSGPSNTVVPDVVGLTQAAAENAITTASLAVGTVTQQSDNGVPSGNVISQTPISGTTVNQNTDVNLVISTGPATTLVPDVTGLSQTQAQNTITGAGLTVGNITQQSDNSVPADDVISQNPMAGSDVSPGTAIDLVVSSGPAMVAVPDVVGQQQAQANVLLVSAGLSTGAITQQNDNAVPIGAVISQNPVSGTMVVAGTSVDLAISAGVAVSFSDEFNANSISDWTLRHVLEGTAAQYTTLDINITNAGQLTIVPTTAASWFASGDGPLIFKTLSGDFAVHARVLADSIGSPGQAPSSNFNSAGLMARNPSGATGPENYIMLNIGRQDSRIPTGVGSESKTTVNSSSTLFLDQGITSGELVLCRIGSNIYSFRNLDNEATWTQLDVFSRMDLPSALQVGMVVNAFAAPADLRAEFDFIRLLPTPSNAADCTP